MGQSRSGPGGAGVPCRQAIERLLHLRPALGGPKDDMASMEHPLFTLATRPDRRILRYAHGDATIEVTPSVKGLATIHDKDVLIFCVSQLMAALNAGRPVGADPAPEGARPPGRHQPRGVRRRLPAAARGVRAAVGDADRHQHRDRRHRGDPRLRADRRLGDPAEGPGRADDPGHRDAVGLDLPLGAVALGADAAPATTSGCASRWSGGSTRSPASTAAGRRSGGSGSRRS